MKKSAIGYVVFVLSIGLITTQVIAANLTLPTGGRVTIELLTSDAVFSNTLSVASLNVSVAITGCQLEPAGGLTGVPIVSEKRSQHGCRVDLDADPATPGIQGFNAGTSLEFRLCAQTNSDANCEFIWSSDPSQNADNFDHVSTTPIHPTDFPGRIFQLAWEDLENGGDQDFNDLIAVVRVETDTDGDGLWDDWEQFGIDADGDGNIDLNLPALGANPQHKDIFVEVDYMDCAIAGGDCTAGDTHSHRPDVAAVAAVVQAFANAPVTNPDGNNGITLHVDVDDAIPHQNALHIPGPNGCFSDAPGIGSFDAVKADPANFGPANPRRFAYHYALFTHQQTPTSTSSGCGELPGNDFQVALGGWNANVGTVQDQADTLMHELGHNLNLHHGGNEETHRKPNYISIMNYAFQGRGGIPPDPDGAGPFTGSDDYSADDLNDLDENNLNEAIGVGNGTDDTRYFCPGGGVLNGDGNGPIDWNCDGDTTDNGLALDINGDGAIGVLTGFNDWLLTPVGNLKLDFQNTGNFADGAHSLSEVEQMDFVAASVPIADAGIIPDGNPKTPPGPPFEPYTCTLGKSIKLNGTGSFDTNGTITSFEWDYQGSGGTAVNATGPEPSFDCSSNVGKVSVLLTVTDNDGIKTSDDATINIAVDAGPDQKVECAGFDGANVTLGSSLPNNGSLTFEWRDEKGNVIGNTAAVNTTVPLGIHTFIVKVTDHRGVAVSDSITVTVEDTTPPAINSITASPNVLWPPNHKMVPITVAASTSDICDKAPICRVISVSSNEPINGTGDGDIAPDWEITGNLAVNLRAERAGNGNGRVYTSTIQCSDASGNKSTGTTTVSVPHDQ